MKPTIKIKVLVDVIMTALLLVLMAYHITGNKVHEWLGVLLFFLFLLHQVFNWKWYKSVFKGNYTAVRSVHTAVNILLMVDMLVMIISGVMLSRDVFYSLNISAGTIGRKLHMVAGAWGFLLVSVHLGLHGSMLIGVAKKLTKTPENRSIYSALTSRTVAVVLSAYGIYAFISKQMWQQLFLLREYTFFDYEEPTLLFLWDYIAIMALFACAAHYSVKLIRKAEVTESSREIYND